MYYNTHVYIYIYIYIYIYNFEILYFGTLLKRKSSD
jgi:hypothetical protein